MQKFHVLSVDDHAVYAGSDAVVTLNTLFLPEFHPSNPVGKLNTFIDISVYALMQ